MDETNPATQTGQLYTQEEALRMATKKGSNAGAAGLLSGIHGQRQH
jgi:hypothetical protein